MRKLKHCLLFIMMGCTSTDPVKEDFEGTWSNASGATLQIFQDGTFCGKDLPTRLLSTFDTSRTRLSGQGEWRLIEDQSRWILKLGFDSTNTRGNYSFGTTLEISGSGILENRRPFYLFLWEGEEGASYRFSFSKKNERYVPLNKISKQAPKPQL
ncbi:hypothetical protein [Dyadobacter bucti]|jgi:hypothetical protein|uniref:hypothetical protein n=1 Tax=Dyadobacter bucti TaxID=2572203 RepID=UPI003F716FB1